MKRGSVPFHPPFSTSQLEVIEQDLDRVTQSQLHIWRHVLGYAIQSIEAEMAEFRRHYQLGRNRVLPHRKVENKHKRLHRVIQTLPVQERKRYKILRRSRKYHVVVLSKVRSRLRILCISGGLFHVLPATAG